MAKSETNRPPAQEVMIIATNGTVEVLRAGAQTWDFASLLPEKNVLHPGDKLRTQSNSQASVRLADQRVVRIDSDGLLQVLPEQEGVGNLHLFKGRFYFLDRSPPGRLGVRTPTVAAATRGTEFHVEVDEVDGSTRLDLFEGEVEMSNTLDRFELRTGEAAVTAPNRPPIRTVGLEIVNILQWCLYYPAVLNPVELQFDEEAQQALNASLTAYLSGDLPQAFAQYPAGRQSRSTEDAVYRAALYLGVGQIESAEGLLNTLDTNPTTPRSASLAAALRRLIAAVKFQELPPFMNPQLSSAWLAESYYQQSRADLVAAREAAQRAVDLAPDFAFAGARLAELEFSFGHIGLARKALDHSLQQAPRNAQAVTLRGFLLAAQDKTAEAIVTFDQAMALDARLANAWLGRGLCRIRRGSGPGGREDLLVAAALEPQRASLRSYLGKAFAQGGDDARGEHELELAKRLDPNDPTAWLYGALLLQRNNRINEAVKELEHSQTLNKNRRLYRSRLLLDQDRSVSGANLAGIYEDAGLRDTGIREAARAVHDDYANYSAHWFLANSYDQLRDPRQVNLRYETPWLSEFLLANLLAPVGAGTLSQTVSQEEYSRLFERNRLGLVSHTEYLSRGDWLQAGSQFGRWGRMEYALEEYYRSEPGQHANGDLELTALSFQTKVQATPQDAFYVRVTGYEAEGGDLRQMYDPTAPAEKGGPILGARFKETQEGLLLAGYHHEWAPGVHTLVLGSRLQDRLSVSTTNQPVLAYRVDANGGVSIAQLLPFRLDYESEPEIYSAESQQIWQTPVIRAIVGGRYQEGDFDTRNRLPASFLFYGPIDTNFVSHFERLSAYGYLHWRVIDPLMLIGGISYDRLTFPANFRSPPIAGHERTVDQVSPKVGGIWSPNSWFTMRGAYARALGGVSFDQSFQLEPAQVAGFVQSYRSLIPESAAGQTSGSDFETSGLALDLKFPTGTYLGISGVRLVSKADRDNGVFRRPDPLVFGLVTATPSTTREDLDYEERTMTIALNQLIGREWVLGAAYRLSDADLRDSFPEVPANALSLNGFTNSAHLEATLHHLNLHALFNHPSGVFARFDSDWYSQHSTGYSQALPGDDFWQLHLQAGYRFLHRQAEVRLGLLNITDQDYRLNPLNLTPELPRGRTLAVAFRFAF